MTPFTAEAAAARDRTVACARYRARIKCAYTGQPCPVCFDAALVRCLGFCRPKSLTVGKMQRRNVTSLLTLLCVLFTGARLWSCFLDHLFSAVMPYNWSFSLVFHKNKRPNARRSAPTRAASRGGSRRDAGFEKVAPTEASPPIPALV